MKNTGNIWLLVGRETEGNNIKNYILMDYNGCTQFVQKRSIAKFCKEHEVINVQLSGDSITGKGIAITALPRYVKQQGFGLQQVSGVSQAEVIQMAQPLINQYMQKKDAELRKKQEDSTEAQKDKQNNYVLNKLSVIENLINIALNMKDITNELASNGQFTRYIKQIDIDNAEGDSLTNLIQRQGVNGLANGLIDRLQRIENRIRKFELDKGLLNKISNLKNQCEQLKKLHIETKQIIKQNKNEKVRLEKEEVHEQKELKLSIDDIQIVEDTETDMIQISAPNDYLENIDDVFNSIPVVDDSNESELIAVESNYEDLGDIPVVDDEKLDINNVIDELFFSHDGYTTSKSKRDDIIEDYRSWDKFGMKIVDIITIIYKGTNNTFMVKADIPPMFRVNGFSSDIFKFPGDYTIKITRENINKAKEGLQNYINNTLQIYADADKLLNEQYTISKELSNEIRQISKNLELEYEFYLLRELSELSNYSIKFVDYIGNGLVARTKNAIKLWEELGLNENIVHKQTISRDIQSLIANAIKIDEKHNKEDIKKYNNNKKDLNNEDDELKERLEHILDEADNILYDIDILSETLSDEYDSYKEYRSGDYISPFVKRAESLLNDIITKFSRELDLSTTSGFHSNREVKAGAWFAGAEFEELNSEATKCTEYVEEVIEQLVNCINSTNILSSKFINNMRSLCNEILDINIDDSDRYDLNSESEFNSVYLDFLGEAYNSNEYDGLKGQVRCILDSLEECIARCSSNFE